MGNCCCKCKCKDETQEANITDTDVNPALEKREGTCYAGNVNEPQRCDEQNIVVSTEQAHKPTTADRYPTTVTNDSGIQENTQKTLQPVTTNGHATMDVKDYVTNENRQQDYVIDDKRGQDYVVNGTRDQNYVIHDTRDQEAMANAYMPHEIKKAAFLPGETDRNTTLPAYTTNTLPSEITGRYSTMVPNGYVEALPKKAPGWTGRGVAVEEMPDHYIHEKAGIVSQGHVNMNGYAAVGCVFEGRCYKKRVFDKNLGDYVYIAD